MAPVSDIDTYDFSPENGTLTVQRFVRVSVKEDNASQRHALGLCAGKNILRVLTDHTESVCFGAVIYSDIGGICHNRNNGRDAERCNQNDDQKGHPHHISKVRKGSGRKARGRGGRRSFAKSKRKTLHSFLKGARAMRHVRKQQKSYLS